MQLEAQTTGYFFYGEHFRGADLIQPSPLFNYEAGSAVGSPFSMGLAQAVLTAGGALLLAVGMIRSRTFWRDGFLLGGLLIATWMITPLSAFAWANIPLLPLTQFPWRFLSIQALFGAAAIGVGWSHLSIWLSERTRAAPALRWLAPAVSGLMAAAALGGLRLDFIPLADSDVTAERLGWYESFSGNIGTTIRYEYLPTWTRPRPYSSDTLLGREPRAKFLSGAGEAVRTTARAASQTWQVTASTPGARVALPLLYWPGWGAWIDGEPAPVEPLDGLGYVQLEVPQGAHTVELRLGRTPLRLGAELASLGALIVAIILLRPRFPRLDWLGWSMVGAVGLTVFGLRLILHSLPEAESRGLLSADFAQEAYFYHAAEGVRFDDGTTLEAAALSLAAGSFDYDLALSGDGEGVTLSLAAPPQQQDQGLVESTGGALPPTPGLYFPLVSADVHALTGAGQPRGAVYLAPLIVPPTPPPVGEAAAAGSDSGEVVLRAWEVEVEGDDLTVELEWGALAEIPRHDAIALRLYDSQGGEWAGLDTQAGGAGLYPTGLWSPGEAVGERYRLDLPHGTPPGSYTLQITLYDAATLRVTSQNEAPVQIDSPSPATCDEAAAGTALYGGIGIESTSLPARASVGDTLPVEIGWLATETPQQAYRAAWALTSGGETAWGFVTDLAPGSDPRTWASGACGAYVLGRHRFELPGDLPPGDYSLSLRLIAEDGEPLGDAYQVGRLAVEERERVFDLPAFDTPVGATFGGLIKLWGYSLEQSGGEVRLEVVWGALKKPEADYKFFVHLYDPETEQIAAQLDVMPHAYHYPTSLWVAGEVVAEQVSLDVQEVPPGRYRIALGWYDPETLTRLPALSENGAPLPGDRYILDEVIPIR